MARRHYGSFAHLSLGAALQAGDDLDFEQVYAEHGGLVRRALSRRGVRPADLDDVVQETFVTVHKLLPTFEGRASMETWLHAVTWRIASGYHRKRRQQRELASGDTPPDELTSIDLPGIERLHDSLERMDPDDRDLFALYEVGGLSISELSEVTGSSRATISERLERARKSLGRIISTPPSAPGTPIDGEPAIESARARVPSELGLERPSFAHDCPDCCFSVWGDHVTARWRGRTTATNMAILVQLMNDTADASPNGITFSSIIEPTSQPPDRQAREITGRAAVQMRGGRLRAAAWSTGTLGRLVVPVVNAYVFLSRSTLNIRFFRDEEGAAAWLAPYFSQLSPQGLLDHCAELKGRLDQLNAK